MNRGNGASERHRHRRRCRHHHLFARESKGKSSINDDHNSEYESVYNQSQSEPSRIERTKPLSLSDVSLEVFSFHSQ